MSNDILLSKYTSAIALTELVKQRTKRYTNLDLASCRTPPTEHPAGSNLASLKLFVVPDMPHGIRRTSSGALLATLDPVRYEPVVQTHPNFVLSVNKY